MTKVVRQIIAILAFAVAAGAEDRSPEPPSIRLTTLPNPITQDVLMSHRGVDSKPATIDSKPGVFAVQHWDSEIGYAWDPVECRMMFCQRNSGVFFIAEGPGPAAATIGAYGPPQFFGYRLTNGGVPEFLYTQGRLGIEEQIKPGEDGKSLKQRFRIENADQGVILAVPERWKDQVKSSAGTRNGDFLNISKNDAEKGFTLNYDLSKPLADPEGVPQLWDPFLLYVEPDPDPLNHGLPIYIDDAPGYLIEQFKIPGNQRIRSLAQLEDDGLLVATMNGEIVIARETIIQPGDVSGLAWSTFSEMPLPGVSIQRSDNMPESLTVSHEYGFAQLFDTDKDGRADFFKAIDGSANEDDLTDAVWLPVDGWDVFETNLKEPDGNSAARLQFTPLGLNPDAPPSPPLDRHSIWVPRLTCASPSSPMFLEDGSTDPKLILADQANPTEWRFARVLPDQSEGTLQGSVFDFQVAEFAAQGLQEVVASSNGNALWGIPEDGSRLVRISPNNSSAFEVESVHLAPDAFEITFSQPIDRKAATDLSNIRIQSTDPLKPGPESTHQVEAAIVDSDGLTLALRIPGLTLGGLVEFNLLRLRSESGETLSHGPVYYTANSLPAFPVSKMGPPDPVQPGNSTPASTEEAPESAAGAESSRESKDDSEAP